METQNIGSDTAQSRIQDTVAVTMLAKGIKGEQNQASELLKSLGAAPQLPEGSGVRLDLFA